MKLKVFNLLLLILLSGAYITKAQNKVYGTVQVNDESFSTNDVFIYDGNNKFLTTPDEKGYYEFFTEKKKMNIIFLLVGSQFIQKETELDDKNEVNITFEKNANLIAAASKNKSNVAEEISNYNESPNIINFPLVGAGKKQSNLAATGGSSSPSDYLPNIPSSDFYNTSIALSESMYNVVT